MMLRRASDATGCMAVKVFARAAAAVLLVVAAPVGAAREPAAAKAAAVAGRGSEPGRAAAAERGERWGVRIEGVRLSAAGYMIDFRYRIVDADKATALVDRRLDPYMIHKASGSRLAVPSPAKIGPLRQTTKYGPPRQGRIYFVLFANPGRIVRHGDRVTVVIGDFRAPDLVAE